MEKNYTISRKEYEDLEHLRQMISRAIEDISDIVQQEPDLTKFQLGCRIGSLKEFIQRKHLEFMEVLEKIENK